MELLKQLCAVRAVSGDERAMTDFVLHYISEAEKNWKVKPTIFAGDEFHENIILVFGNKPRTAIFAHMDSIGFTVRYGKQLVKVGGPVTKKGFELVGNDSQGEIDCKLKVNKDTSELKYKFNRKIDRGTNLSFKPDFRETEDSVQCCYMDNRLGVWNALKVAETLEEGIIVFSTREEHGGGAVSYLGKFIQEKYGVRQALISDITWVTEGVQPGLGVAISMRDRGLPRRTYLNHIIEIANQSGIPFQLEVEGAGGSDGLELQSSPFPWEWVFVGAPEDNVHTPDEIVHKKDIEAMTALYKVLMEKL
ncbi:MAG: aminopeptidase [Flavobacteriales bacterium]|nr:aminopeptidase [Flavobacteriales bacterium]